MFGSLALAAALLVTVETNGREMAMEWFRPEHIGKRPAVLVLHGADGPARHYREVARLLAGDGYEVFLPRYYDSGIGAGRRDNFKFWVKAVRDAITFISHRPGVDGERIGLLGFSLGAYLALSAGVIDPRVDCVVDYAGGLPPAMAAIAARTPPVLILHGAEDRLVPVAEAEKLAAFLKRRDGEYETKIYDGQGHIFTGEAALDGAARTAAFLGRYLGAADAASRGIGTDH